MTVASLIRPETTLRRIRALEHLYTQGYQDSVVDLTVRKLLERQLREETAKLRNLEQDLADFEVQFGMSSAEFAAKYDVGKMGDDADVFEWRAIYTMAERLRQEVDYLARQIEEKLGASSPADDAQRTA